MSASTTEQVLRTVDAQGYTHRLEEAVALLPTPAVNDMGAGKTVEWWDEWAARQKAADGRPAPHGKSLEIEAQRLLPTPAARDHKGPNPNQRTGGVDLPTALLPTPRATDGDKGGPNQTNGRGVRDSRPGVVPWLVSDGEFVTNLSSGEVDYLLPTPTAKQGRNETAGRTPGSSFNTGTTLQDVAYKDDFGPYGPAIARWEQVMGRPAPSPTEPNKDGRPRLSPRFVEFMMGLPAGWVTDTGIPRNAQLKALGNGVVPQQCALALSILLPRLGES